MRNTVRRIAGGVVALASVTALISTASAQEEELGPLTGVYSVVATCEQSVKGVLEDDPIVYRYFARVRQGPRFTEIRLTEKFKPAEDFSLYYLGRNWPAGTVGGGFARACGGSYFRDETFLIREPDDSGDRLVMEADSIFTTDEYPDQPEARIVAKCEYTFTKLPRDVVPAFPECGIEPGEVAEPAS